MFFSRRYKLQGSGQAFVITVPIAVVRAFKLTRDSHLNVSYEDKKLVIDLDASPTNAQSHEAHVSREVAA
jgi:hypothetical protein